MKTKKERAEYMRKYNDKVRIAKAKEGELLKECPVCGRMFKSIGNHLVIHRKEFSKEFLASLKYTPPLKLRVLRRIKNFFTFKKK